MSHKTWRLKDDWKVVFDLYDFLHLFVNLPFKVWFLKLSSKNSSSLQNSPIQERTSELVRSNKRSRPDTSNLTQSGNFMKQFIYISLKCEMWKSREIWKFREKAKFCENHEFYSCNNQLLKRTCEILCSNISIFEVLLCRIINFSSFTLLNVWWREFNFTNAKLSHYLFAKFSHYLFAKFSHYFFCEILALFLSLNFRIIFSRNFRIFSRNFVKTAKIFASFAKQLLVTLSTTMRTCAKNKRQIKVTECDVLKSSKLFRIIRMFLSKERYFP